MFVVHIVVRCESIKFRAVIRCNGGCDLGSSVGANLCGPGSGGGRGLGSNVGRHLFFRFVVRVRS